MEIIDKTAILEQYKERGIPRDPVCNLDKYELEKLNSSIADVEVLLRDMKILKSALLHLQEYNHHVDNEGFIDTLRVPNGLFGPGGAFREVFEAFSARAQEVQTKMSPEMLQKFMKTQYKSS